MNQGAAIVSDKQLGDTLLLQPSAEFLARKLGKPTALYVREAFQPLVELMPGCCLETGKGCRYEQVWSTSWSSRAVWQAFRLRTKVRTLIANKPRHVRWWYRLLFHSIRLEPPSAEYWARYFWRVVSGLPEADFVPPRLEAPPAVWRHGELPNNKFVLVNPTAAWQRKFWGTSQWAEFAVRLARLQPGLAIVIAGGGSEREIAHCQEIVNGITGSGPVVNLAGKTSLQQYLHALSAASAVACVDGAASHLAQAFGVPALTLFGPTHDGKWHWPTPQHVSLAARNYNATGTYGPASDIPVDAAWEAFSSIFRTD